MSVSALDAYDLVRFAEALEPRLQAAQEQLAARAPEGAEAGWLATALALLREARAPAAGLLERARGLPDLEEVRDEFAEELQNVWVDTLEKLHGGITFCAGSRSPVIDALFPHLKFPQLRRAPRDAAADYQATFERRRKSAYVTRILGGDEFAVVRPVLEQVAAAWEALASCHAPTELPADEAAALRDQLVALGTRLQVVVAQARLLAEAALVVLPGVFEAEGLALKPRRRAGRAGTLPAAEAPAAEGTGPEGAAASATEEAEAAGPVVAEPLPAAPGAHAAAPPAEAMPPAAPPEPEASTPAAPEAQREVAAAAEVKPARRSRKKAAPKPPDAEV